MRVVTQKSPVCQACTASARADHIFVTLRSIQLRGSAFAELDSADWLEVAPELANEPRQIDLIGDSPPELLVENAVVPAGSYREVRLQFLPDSPVNTVTLPAENACGDTRWNCVVTGDGRTKPLRWTDDAPELMLAIRNAAGGDLLVILPGGIFDLQLSLEAAQVPYSSAAEGWTLLSALVGRASVTRKWPIADDSASN